MSACPTIVGRPVEGPPRCTFTTTPYTLSLHDALPILMEARALMGEDFWSYGVAPNRKTLQTFLRHHHSQGLSSRLVTVEEMFHPGTLETFKL